MGLLRAIELTFIDALATPVGAECRSEALLDKAPAHALDGRDPSVERLGNALVRPARSALGLIGLEQDLGVLDLANIGFAPRQQPLKLLAFVSRERHAILLGHNCLLTRHHC